MKTLIINHTAATHIGGRQTNEDNYLVNETLATVRPDEMCRSQGRWDTAQIRVAAVCDGVGGGACGDTAAALALNTIAAAAKDLHEPLTEELVLSLAEAARKEVTDYFDHQPRRGGCTLSMAALLGEEFIYLNIGDSPGFLRRKDGGDLTELSRRHNLFWEKRRQGICPDPDDECRLMRYLGKRGLTARDMAHVTRGVLNPGDRLLLCSDGITNGCTTEKLSAMLEGNAYAADMVLASVSCPEADNATAVCLLAEDAAR